MKLSKTSGMVENIVMRLRELRTVCVKELRSLLRDRHILIYSVAVPAFLYPAVLLGVVQVLTYVRGVEERRSSSIELIDDVTGGRLRRALRESGAPLEIRDGVNAELTREVIRDRLAGQREAAVDAVVIARSGKAASDNVTAPVVVEVYHTAARDSSELARRRAQEAVTAFREDLLGELARNAGGGEWFLDTVRVEEVSFSSPGEVANHVVGLVLPLLMILMTALGAFYPALDAAVGEKERRSLETTLVAPIHRGTTVLGKYLAVTFVALLSFGLNLLGMYVTFTHFQAQFSIEGFSITWTALAVIFVAAVLLAAFFSAVMMLLAFLARSFKEGQSYVTPIYLVSLVPIAVTTNPEVHLTPGLAWVPLVNTALLFRDALEQRLETVPALIALFSSAALAVVALFVSARVLGHEGIATGADTPLARWRRRARLEEEVVG